MPKSNDVTKPVERHRNTSSNTLISENFFIKYEHILKQCKTYNYKFNNSESCESSPKFGDCQSNKAEKTDDSLYSVKTSKMVKSHVKQFEDILSNCKEKEK